MKITQTPAQNNRSEKACYLLTGGARTRVAGNLAFKLLITAKAFHFNSNNYSDLCSESETGLIVRRVIIH
jgi:hypothetical protein